MQNCKRLSDLKQKKLNEIHENQEKLGVKDQENPRANVRGHRGTGLSTVSSKHQGSSNTEDSDGATRDRGEERQREGEQGSTRGNHSFSR